MVPLNSYSEIMEADANWAVKIPVVMSQASFFMVLNGCSAGATDSGGDPPEGQENIFLCRDGKGEDFFQSGVLR